jgi:hypothetical protein
VEAAREISWRPLGELFVENGLLTREHLEQALKEQAESGGRLGDKLVELGYITRHALARLLAEQTGVEFDVDSGFGTGLLAELQRRKEGVAYVVPDDFSEPAAPAGRWTPTVIHSEPEPVETHNRSAMSTFAALEELWARLAAAEARIGELERELRGLAPRTN